jgi:hypothetical protein
LLLLNPWVMLFMKSNHACVVSAVTFLKAILVFSN